MTVAEMQSLQDFADELEQERSRPWPEEHLPPEVQEQIITAKASIAATVAWLRKHGYEDATTSRIDHWRRAKRAERAEQDRGITR